MKLKIGLDLDGVIIDHTINKIKLAKQKGYFLKPAETTSEIMKGLIPLHIYQTIQANIYGKKGLSSESMKDAKKIIKKIMETFSPPYIASRRGIKKSQAKFAAQWLKNNHFSPPLPLNQIFFVESDLQKNTICEKLNINVYLDDKTSVLLKLPSVKYRTLFDPWGHYYKNPPEDIKVVKSWKEFYKYLQELTKL